MLTRLQIVVIQDEKLHYISRTIFTKKKCSITGVLATSVNWYIQLIWWGKDGVF